MIQSFLCETYSISNVTHGLSRAQPGTVRQNYSKMIVIGNMTQVTLSLQSLPAHRSLIRHDLGKKKDYHDTLKLLIKEHCVRER